MRVCLQAREDSLAGFLEDALRGGVEECAHAGQRGKLVGTIVTEFQRDRGDALDCDTVVAILRWKPCIIYLSASEKSNGIAKKDPKQKNGSSFAFPPSQQPGDASGGPVRRPALRRVWTEKLIRGVSFSSSITISFRFSDSFFLFFIFFRIFRLNFPCFRYMVLS